LVVESFLHLLTYESKAAGEPKTGMQVNQAACISKTISAFCDWDWK
jgi:hypothetical protein